MPGLPRFQCFTIQYGWRVWDRILQERVCDFTSGNPTYNRESAEKMVERLNRDEEGI